MHLQKKSGFLFLFFVILSGMLHGQEHKEYKIIGRDTVPIANIVRFNRDTIREELYDENHRYMFRKFIRTRASYIVGSRIRGTSHVRFYAERSKKFNGDAVIKRILLDDDPIFVVPSSDQHKNNP